MLSKSENTYRWMNLLQLQLEDFLESPLGGSDKGLLDLMKQYQEAVKFKQVEPPTIRRKLK